MTPGLRPAVTRKVDALNDLILHLATLAALAPVTACAATVDLPVPLDAPAALEHWHISGGEWTVSKGALTQTREWYSEASFAGSAHAFLKAPAFADFTLSYEFLVEAPGSGVGAAQCLLRSTDNRNHYLIQFSSQASGVYLVRSDTRKHWSDIKRAYNVAMPRGQWHQVRVIAAGPAITIEVGGVTVLEARDDALSAGLIGFGTSQAVGSFRNIHIQGDTAELTEPWRDTGGKIGVPDYKVICEDGGAGGYEAFPDVCRCANGDLLCVFYAGYEHVSFPRADLPRGARICAVRSSDEGQTWGPPEIVADTQWDDRDPHICCTKDGTLICNWFTYYGDWQPPDSANPGHFKELWLNSSTDNGKTWSEPHLVPNTAGMYWGCSGTVRELSDGALIWPIYREYQQPLRAWSAVIRSTDGGKTWSDPIWVDETNADNDEPDLIELPDGRLLCMMRANHGDSMWYSWSEDKGLSWTPSEKVGFPGHAPYMLRTTAGILLLAHRLPNTALHYSLDDGKTWSETVEMDVTIGAYPSMVELRDGTVLFVYYEEGQGSSIRAQKIRATREGIQRVKWEE